MSAAEAREDNDLIKLWPALGGDQQRTGPCNLIAVPVNQDDDI